MYHNYSVHQKKKKKKKDAYTSYLNMKIGSPNLCGYAINILNDIRCLLKTEFFTFNSLLSYWQNSFLMDCSD
jgi:hypothetical protein